MAFETAETMNKIIEKQANDTDWPGGKFTRLWERIQSDEKPDDDMAEFELDEELRKITLSRKKDPKDSLAKILAVCNHCGKSGHEEKDCWKKHPELIPAKFAKSGAAISDEILVTSIVGLNVPANTKHVFGSENENSSRTKNKYHGFGKFYG